ncbi:MAG: hypothetical protein M9951_16920 [Burkholderiaceae bacterium]|nr:hypothetical protein [Burkholderiaceae bacterium]
MTTILGARRERVMHEITGQIDGLIDALLESPAANDYEESSVVTTLLVRIREINSVVESVLDEADGDIDGMERIVFGRVMAPCGLEAETTAEEAA